jgi:septal ring factor EnvC (AmiA/AmiB activator)
LSFGDKTQFGSTSKGVVLESDGQTVVAPSAGRVLFAGTFRNYGNLVIIDACNVDVLVAGIETISTSAHALVEEGQVIGTMVGSGNPVYLEVRRANRAINPFGSLSE